LKELDYDVLVRQKGGSMGLTFGYMAGVYLQVTLPLLQNGCRLQRILLRGRGRIGQESVFSTRRQWSSGHRHKRGCAWNGTVEVEEVRLVEGETGVGSLEQVMKHTGEDLDDMLAYV